MNITINNNFKIHKFSQPSVYSINTGNKDYLVQINGQQDYFVKSPSFNGKKINKKVIKRVEDQLRNLDGVHDPYSDVILLGKHKFKNLQEKVKKRTNTESMIKLLSGYTEHMFPDGELKVFELLKYEAKHHPKSAKHNTFHDILIEHLPESKIRLVNNQLDVIDYMRDFTRKNFDKNDQKKIAKRLNKLETDIIDDDFRIKPSKTYLAELYKEIPDRKKVKSLIKITNDFPNGATSIDAFIVKNANKTQEEIAEALVSPSQISVEHYKPESTGGEDKATNMIAASKRMNNLRGSMDYDDFIEMFPDIPRQTQRYTDDIIKKINRGGIPDIAMTLPEVKSGLYKESHGKIDIDISQMNPQVVTKINSFKTKVNTLIECFQHHKIY